MIVARVFTNSSKEPSWERRYLTKYSVLPRIGEYIQVKEEEKELYQVVAVAHWYTNEKDELGKEPEIFATKIERTPENIEALWWG